MVMSRDVRRTQQYIFGESGAAVIQTQSSDFKPLHGFDLDHLLVATATQNYPLGMLVDFADGRRFRYVKAIAAVAKGTIATMNTSGPFGQSVFPPHGALQGQTRLVLRKSSGSTTATANRYAGGIMAITGTAGGDESARIFGHEAIPAGVADTDTFILEVDPPGFRTALTTTSTALLAASKYEVRAQAATRIPIGLCVYEQMTAGQFGFVQTRGITRFKGAITNGTDGDLLHIATATALENVTDTGEIPVARAVVTANKIIDLVCE